MTADLAPHRVQEAQNRTTDAFTWRKATPPSSRDFEHGVASACVDIAAKDMARQIFLRFKFNI
jgi:hypothetical protein